ncbi:MAG TPA: hypothetical protein VHO03_03745 [Ignavibacteriales bacterium]|nr:hypothetical protein [Ignavibacteriales bacterium]
MAKVDCKILSDKCCKDCSRKLKQNLLNRNPKAERCFRCHILAKEPHNRYKRLHIKVPAYMELSIIIDRVFVPPMKALKKKLAGAVK